MPTNVRDPRTIITPDAFRISPELLGTPLAPPWRRFWALMIDLLVISVLTAMFDTIWMFVWGAVGLILVWLAFRKGPRGATQAVSVMLRTATGCLGVVVILVVGVAWLAIRLSDDGPPLPRDVAEELAREGVPIRGLSVAATALGARERLAEAQTADEAEEAAVGILEGLDAEALDDSDRMEVLRAFTPADAAWADEAEDIYERALERWEEEPGDPAPPAGDTGADTTVEAMSDAEVLDAYARLLEADSAAAGDAGALALRRRAAELVAGDSLAALERRVRSAREDVESERRRRREAQAELDEGGNAFVELLRDVWEQLGSAIGLWSLYFTILLTLWRGQTVGKRLLGLRVLRLDGEPITWWPAFERAGGYIAGLATGLLGFAQVFWDPNRQCIHDKIVGTVVVDTRVARVPGAWEEAWTDPGEEGGV